MNTTDKNTHGGARKGAGRKAIDTAEKKKQVNFYIKQKNVEKLTKLINELIAKHDK